MPTYSQNGWPVNPPRTSRTIPGSGVRVTVADGPAGDVLMYVLGEIDRCVEDIDLRSTRGEFDDWGYADRSVRGSTDTSNHASATAVDVNATRHALGAVGTFSPPQVAEIRRILGEVDHVVRWGGDYSGRRDEMHFEIDANFAAVARVADRINTPPPPEEDEDMSVAYVRGDSRQQIPGTKNVYGDVVFLVEWDVQEGVTRARVTSPADPGYRLWRELGRPVRQVSQAALDAVVTLTPEQAAKAVTTFERN